MTQNLVMLITGGLDRDERRLSSSELWAPGPNSISCQVNASMSLKRYMHSSYDGVACGGWGGNDSMTSCDRLDTRTGEWSRSHTLKQRRYNHVMWRRSSGDIIIMGGYYNETRTTTEVLKDDGSSDFSFNLTHDTRYVDLLTCVCNDQH